MKTRITALAITINYAASLHLCVCVFGCVWCALVNSAARAANSTTNAPLPNIHAEAIKIINLRQTIRVVPCLVSLCGGVWAGNLKPFSNHVFPQNQHNEAREIFELC